MSAPTAKDVKALRDLTGAGMLDCRNALVETGRINPALLPLTPMLRVVLSAPPSATRRVALP